jgi:hypothetical protein
MDPPISLFLFVRILTNRLRRATQRETSTHDGAKLSRPVEQRLRAINRAPEIVGRPAPWRSITSSKRKRWRPSCKGRLVLQHSVVGLFFGSGAFCCSTKTNHGGQTVPVFVTRRGYTAKYTKAPHGFLCSRGLSYQNIASTFWRLSR